MCIPTVCLFVFFLKMFQGGYPSTNHQKAVLTEPVNAAFSDGARRYLQQKVMFFMKHHPAAKLTLILHQPDRQGQPQ